MHDSRLAGLDPNDRHNISNVYNIVSIIKCICKLVGVGNEAHYDWNLINQTCTAHPSNNVFISLYILL